MPTWGSAMQYVADAKGRHERWQEGVLQLILILILMYGLVCARGYIGGRG